MKRWLLNLAAATSLLLCVATLGLWVRSYWRSDFIAYNTHDSSRPGVTVTRWWRMSSTIGELTLASGSFTISSDSTPDGTGWHYFRRGARPEETLGTAIRLEPEATSGWFLGFGFYFKFERAHYLRAVCVPHWFVTLLAAALPVVRFRALRRARRAQRMRLNLCPTCGYDLRATLDRCPECGAVPAVAGRS